MGLRKCCVGGCTSTSETHRLFLFPKNDNLRALWLSFLVPTNPYLAGLTKRQLICKRVCSKHFDRQQFDEEGQRLRYSYPCLLSDLEIALGEPQSTAEWNLLNEHNYFQKLAVEPQTSADTVREQPSTSFATTSEMEQFSDTSLQTQSKNYGIESAVEVQTSADTVREQPSTSFATTSEMNYGIESAVKVQTSADTVREQPSTSFATTSEMNYGIESAVKVQTSADTVREQPSTSFATTSEMNYGIESAVKVQTSAIIKRKPSKKGKLVERIKTISAKNLGNSAVQTLQQAQQMLASPVIIENFLALPKHARNFIEVQLKHVNKKKMARRFTLDEKLMALSIMKQSPKGYKLLEKMFTLPNKRTLSRVSENIDFEPGLNPHIFEHLKKTVNNWDEKKKLCSILYDEVALTPHITFDENKDEIIGFVDVNGKKKMAYCDHALVFMVRGVCASWRQCIAYHFVQGTVSAAELKVILKDVVVQVAQTGLIPVALVSDQGSTFRTTIRNLRLDSNRSRTLEGLRDDGTVNVAGHSLNVFFDPPHLLKSLRNNFINKDVLWGDKMASWKDILYVYDIDSKLGLTRALPKLTAYHVDHNKMRKMKVSIAAQVLSARTAAMLKYTDAIRQDPQSTMTTTAEFVEFVDTLFDSVNGYPGGGQRGKLRKAVKSDSAHAKFWSSAIKQLKSIKFIDRNSKAAVKSGARYVRVPCLEGWITSLESFIRLSKLLFEKYHVDFYYPRYINQDPLENFFGRLRALNYRNTNPDANTFKYSFKSLMLSNVLSPHSRFSNCEQDEGETIMAINHMFNKKRNVNKENEMIDDKENVSPNSNDYANLITSCLQNSPGDLMGQVIDEKMRVHCSAYAAGFICRKITKTTNCKQCIKTYISQNIENIHMYIRYREYKTLKNNNLAYPNENFLRLYRDATQLIHSYLNVFCHRKHDLGLKLKNMLLNKLPLLYDIGCNIHKRKVQDLFLKIVIRLQVHNWCKIINKILKGAIEEKYVLKMNEPQKMALKKYESFRIRKKCLKI